MTTYEPPSVSPSKVLFLLAAAAAAVLGLVLPGTAQQNQPYGSGATRAHAGIRDGEIRIDCGGNHYVSSAQEHWAPDHGYSSPSHAFKHSTAIGGTADPELYQDGREGAAFLYSVAIPNGLYDITLHFAEHQFAAPGARTFDVRCEGVPWISGLDLVVVAGGHQAYTQTLRRQVLDGRVDLEFLGVTGQALVNAIEVRSPRILIANHGQLDFGTVDLGASQTKNLVLRNRGLHTLVITEIAFLITAGAGHDFELHLAGEDYTGGHADVQIPVSIVLEPDGMITAPVVYTPTEHVPNDVRLRFDGNFEAPVEVRLLGSGGTGHPFMHAVILVADETVDFDQDGSEPVVLDGSDSHTHELGHTITSWTWTSKGVTIGSGPVLTLPFGIGPHEVELVVGDDNTPPHELTDHAEFDVVPLTAVSGVLALYYATPGTDPTPLLTNVPVHADQAAVLPGFSVTVDQSIGGSITASNGMVRLQGDLEVESAGSYTFTASGGVARALLVDGQPVSGAIELASGPHEIEARFALTTAAGLPLAVLVAVAGGSPTAIDPELVTHDESGVLPVINGMPEDGLQQGGYPVSIEGFGFFPRANTQVVFGATVIPEQNFRHWEPGRIEVLAPGGNGTVEVRVQNANGSSAPHLFTYSSNGSIPIVFESKPPIYLEQPTSADWGPDGRLYVGTIGGEIKAIAFDGDYQATSITTYAGVSGLANKNILGVTFAPWDAGSPPRLFVAHTLLFQHGGGAFEGPSPYPGQISVLHAPTFDSPEAVVTKLPTSNHDHGINGMVFDDNGDLLFAVGGNTNAGVRHPHLGDVPESPLSAAILKALLSRPDFDGDLGYALAGEAKDDQVYGEVVDLVQGADHVLVHAAGIRNAYDLALTTKNLLYATDNGPNLTYGPASTGMTTQVADPETNDELVLVEKGNYYGHPNRNRGRFDERQAIYRAPDGPALPEEYTPPIAILPPSSNGITEYRANAFNGALKGQLLVQKWNDHLYRVRLASDGRDAIEIAEIHPLLGALDVVTGPGGAILGIDYTNNRIVPLVPDDAGVPPFGVYDITPWRGGASGGTPFTIGGSGFGALSETTVTFGGVPATLTSVTPRRIHGVVPALPSAAGTLQTVVVSGSGAGQVGALSQAFRFLYPPGQGLGAWTSDAPMPESLGEVACGVIGNHLYLVGEGSGNTLACDLFTMTWTNTLAVRPFVGHHHSAEVYGGRLYLIGGLHGGSEGRVQIYEPGSNSWIVGAAMPWPGGSVSTSLIGGTIYAAGGIVGSTTVDFCASYDIATNTWTPRASMPFQQGRNHAAAGTDGQRFFIFGGRGVGSGDANFVANGFDTTQIYNPLVDAWTTSLDAGATLVPLPQRRGGMGKAVFYAGEFYVIGGETIDGGGGATTQGVYARVDVYNPQTNTWRLDRPMPTARHGIFPVKFQGRVFVAGGGTVAAHSSSSILEIFTRQ